MLVLSRRMGESVVIGDDIVITVLEYRGDVVRIGVEAPRHVQVRRAELLAELAETNRAAASPGEGAVAGLSRLVSGSGRPQPPPTEQASGPGPEPESGPAREDARPRPRPPRLGPPAE
ncbi:MAG: carbon storage regulator [Nocardioidaceae bacterium]|jgi:carbon storage regulator|nr:carbon storage regulator [Nocardioidaceae bacterium]